jgi:hypothetical protein
VSAFRLVDLRRGPITRVAALCRMLGVSKSSYYAWRGRTPSMRNLENAVLIAKIREIRST